MQPPTTFLTVGELRDHIESLLSSGQVQLPIESGIHVTNGNKGWQAINFSKRFITTPSVIAQGTFKAGAFPQVAVDLPTVSPIPAITLPTVSIPSVTVPNVTIPTIPYTIPRLDVRDAITGYSTIAEYMATEGRKQFLIDTQGWWWVPASLIRDALSWAIFGLNSFVGSFFDWFVKDYIQPHFDNVESTLKGVRNAINYDIVGSAISPKAGTVNRAFDDLENALQSALDEITGGVNTGYETFKGSIEGAFEGVTTQINTASRQTEVEIESAINNQVNRLYEYLGILDGAPFVPTKINNITPLGFSLYSTGAPEYHWVAVGV